MLPADVWQHVLPAGRQFPALQSLSIAGVTHPFAGPAAGPEGSRLVSCCPGLRSLDLRHLQHNVVLLATLQHLKELHTLLLAPTRAAPAGGADDDDEEDGGGGGGAPGLEVVSQLTQLRELSIHAPCAGEELLLGLMQLKQLTTLTYCGQLGGVCSELRLSCEVSAMLQPAPSALSPSCFASMSPMCAGLRHQLPTARCCMGSVLRTAYSKDNSGSDTRC